MWQFWRSPDYYLTFKGMPKWGWEGHPRRVPTRPMKPLFCRRTPDLLEFYWFSDDYSGITFAYTFDGGKWDSLSDQEKRELTMGIVSRNPPVGDGGSMWEGSDPVFAKKFPGLSEHLTMQEWPDNGAERTPSTITFFLGSAGPTALLKDRERNVALFASADNWLGLFDALERAVNDPKAIWRADRNDTGGSARIRKKK